MVRAAALAAERSLASLRRELAPSMSMISARWTRRSMRVTVHAACGKTSDHSAKGLLVLRMMERGPS